MTVGFNPNASFLHLTARFTRKVGRKIKRRKKSLGNLNGLFGTKNKNFHKTQPFSYEAAEAILGREGSETITMFFWFQSSAGELVVYGPAANHGEMEKAYRYIRDICEQKERRRKRRQKLWSVMGKVAIIATPIGAAIAGILLYLALTRQ